MKTRIYHHKGMQYKVGHLGKIFRLTCDGEWVLCHLNTVYQKARAIRKTTPTSFFKKLQGNLCTATI